MTQNYFGADKDNAKIYQEGLSSWVCFLGVFPNTLWITLAGERSIITQMAKTSMPVVVKPPIFSNMLHSL